MKTLSLILGIAILVAVGGFFIFNTDEREVMNPDSGAQTKPADAAPKFSLQDYSGKTVSISDFAGKPLLVNSWAAWCPFCRKELVDFAAVQKEFGDKIAIVAVDRAESRDVAKRYTDELGVTEGMVFLLDPSDSFYRSIGGFSMPETIFVDSEGNIVFHKRGPMDVEEIRAKLKEFFQV